MLATGQKTTKATQSIGAAMVLFALLLPLFACLGTLSSNSQTSLPACCRLHGKHHCTMSAEQLAALLQGNHFTEVRGKCPLYPHSATTPGTHGLLLYATVGYSANSASSVLLRRQIETLNRLLLDGGHYTRGPPIVRPS